jgi:predicted transcriptional regulator
MRLRNIVELLDGEVLTRTYDFDLDIEITSACGADLMSDVLAFVHSGTLLLTGLTNPQVIRTGEVVEVAAIVLVRGKIAPPETVHLAEEKRIPLICSPHTLFECCGRVYAAGVESCDVHGSARVDVNRRLQEYVRSGSAQA